MSNILNARQQKRVIAKAVGGCLGTSILLVSLLFPQSAYAAGCLASGMSSRSFTTK
ncbi:MAG: hypothetical protein LKJ47_01400 [Bifidobacteriaceae bacterium]|jgi:hypothetical protein|nr:hypothetical protein [Bifidobacteriaceae bacterium]